MLSKLQAIHGVSDCIKRAAWVAALDELAADQDTGGEADAPTREDGATVASEAVRDATASPLTTSVEKGFDPAQTMLPPTGQQPERRLTRNAARCRKCGDVIESTHRHDYVVCGCGAIFTDGGLDYVRRGGTISAIEDLSEWEDE